MPWRLGTFTATTWRPPDEPTLDRRMLDELLGRRRVRLERHDRRGPSPGRVIDTRPASFSTWRRTASGVSNVLLHVRFSLQVVP